MAASMMLDDTPLTFTPCKKRRQSFKPNDSLFQEFPVMLIKGLADVLNHWLLDKDSFTFKTLTALKILNCNAADPRQGNSFSHVFCSAEPYQQLHSLGDIFTKGLSMLTDFMSEKKVPMNIQEKHVLGKLLSFMTKMMTNEAEQVVMKNLGRFNETELTVVLANHLFGKLSTSETFVMDKHSQFKRKIRGRVKCPCETTTCELAGLFGDTSVGNCMVWHGNLDIIINNEIVLKSVAIGNQDCSNDVSLQEDYADDESCGDSLSLKEDDEESPRGKSPIEVKVKDCLFRNSQILAETIVFSFLQKQRHPTSEHFLFPCIGVTGKELIVFCYDSQHDVLLESSTIPLLSENLTALGKINSLAVVVAWLVVNYKYLCSGLTEDMKASKAMFFSQAKSKMTIYENMLKFGDVGNAYHVEETPMDFLPPEPTSILEQLNKKILKLRLGTELTNVSASVNTE